MKIVFFHTLKLGFARDVEFWSSECSSDTCHAYSLTQLSGRGNIQKVNNVDVGTSANKIFTVCGTCTVLPRL